MVSTASQSSRTSSIRVRLGTEPLLLPDELGLLADTVTRHREAPRLFTAAEDTEWLFPGTIAGYPISADALTSRLAMLGISPRAARKTALVNLALQLPPAIVSRLTGLNATSAARWAEAIAASNASTPRSAGPNIPCELDSTAQRRLNEGRPPAPTEDLPTPMLVRTIRLPRELLGSSQTTSANGTLRASGASGAGHLATWAPMRPGCAR